MIYKIGTWVPVDNTVRGHKFMCSVCKSVAYFPQPTRDRNWTKHCEYQYCPWCGVVMKGRTK